MTARRWFIDWSLASADPNVTGISRVAGELVRHFRPEAEHDGHSPHGVVVRESRFHESQGGVVAPVSAFSLARHLRSTARRIDEWLRDHAPAVDRLLTRAVMAAGGIPAFGQQKPVAGGPAIAFRQGDVLLLADATWMIPRWQPAVESAKAQGSRIVPLIHDLLPWSHSQFFAPLFCAQFTRWLHNMLPLADAVICNSLATAAALEQFASAEGLADALPPVGVFSPGSRPTVAVAAPRPEVAAIFADGVQPFLMVGTIEPRKNHGLVLDAFERLWAAGGPTPLTVIGRRGWQCEATLRRFASLAAAGKPFTHIGDATDADLQHAYRHARCLIFPSIAEGFGLPIVEALAQGLPVIASDIPVHREAGGDLVTYIPLGDPSHLASVLKSIADGSTVLKAPSTGKVHLLTWAESAAALRAELDRLFALR